MRISKIIPSLDKHRHKGQNGKIGVIGGSMEYTGAPYYAAISSLKGGGDLGYIYCTKSAAIPIKSYSPECIVYPYLLEQGEEENFENSAFKLIQSTAIMNSLIIGPGLGREQITGKLMETLLHHNNSLKVLDADALWHISQKQNNLIKIIQEKSQQFILTPNAIEVKRLLEYFEMAYHKPEYKCVEETNYDQMSIEKGYPYMIAELSRKLNNAVIVAKGQNDVITDGNICYEVYTQGSAKRCGGQGDILSGLIGLYSYWAQESKNSLLNGCLLGCIVTRKAAFAASKQNEYSLTTPKIIEYIGQSISEAKQL